MVGHWLSRSGRSWRSISVLNSATKLNKHCKVQRKRDLPRTRFILLTKFPP